MKTVLVTAGVVLLAASTASAHWGYYYGAPVVVDPVPTVAYYAPPATYYAPAPTVAYYAPAPAYAYAPVVVPRRYLATVPVVVPAPVYVAPRVFVPGQPVRNTLRAVFP